MVGEDDVEESRALVEVLELEFAPSLGPDLPVRSAPLLPPQCDRRMFSKGHFRYLDDGRRASK